MIHTYVNKKDRIYRYYVCVKAHQRGWAQCETRSVSAQALEDAVVEQLRGIGRNPAVLREVVRQIDAHRRKESTEIETEKSTIEGELKRIAQEMKRTVSVAGTASSADVATRRLAELQDRVSHLTGRLAEIRQQLTAMEAEGVDFQDVEAALRDFGPLWEQLSTWEKERFIRALVEQVRYDGKTGTVTLGFRSRGIKDLCNWAPALTEKYERREQRI
jgi:site-specific DNA recombinase